jgi:hypothetical protein
MTDGDLRRRFKHHPPRDEKTIEHHQHVRSGCTELALCLNDLLPEGREKSLAITHLEEVMMWSNAAIARAGAPA